MTTYRNDTDAVSRTLERIDRAQRWLIAALAGVAVVEAAGILGFVLLVDLGDPTHRLLIAHAVLVYGTLSLGLVALAVMSARNTLRILCAIELMERGGQA